MKDPLTGCLRLTLKPYLLVLASLGLALRLTSDPSILASFFGFFKYLGIFEDDCCLDNI